MGHRKRTQVFLGGASIACYILLVFSELPLLYRSGIAFFILLCAGLWIHGDRKKHQEAQRRSLERCYQDFLRTMTVYRHDLLNELQILNGYIRLKKEDKLLGHVEKIKDKLYKDSQISKLGVPSLVLFLLCFRSQSDTMVLEIEMDEEIDLSSQPVNHELLESAVRCTLEHFHHMSQSFSGEPSTLHLKMGLLEGVFRLDFVYSGQCDTQSLEGSLLPGLKEKTKHCRWDIQHSFRPSQANLSILIPLPE